MSTPQTEATVLLDISGPVATLTLNRPDRLNAMTVEMDQALREAVMAACAAPQCRVIVITGAGRGFCSGADRESTSAAPREPSWSIQPKTMDEFRFGYLVDSPKPVVAALNGAAIGAGLILACYCDIRLAVSDAKLGFPFSRLGLVAEYGIAKQLPLLIGGARARELLLSGRQFSGAQALEMGLVSHTADADGFKAMVTAYANALAGECSPRSLGVIRRQLHDAQEQDWIEALNHAGDEQLAARSTADYAEALDARRERRAPVFTGD